MDFNFGPFSCLPPPGLLGNMGSAEVSCSDGRLACPIQHAAPIRASVAMRQSLVCDVHAALFGAGPYVHSSAAPDGKFETAHYMQTAAVDLPPSQ